MFTSLTPDRQLCLHLDGDGHMVDIAKQRGALDMSTFPVISAIVHRHIWGVNGDTQISQLFHPQYEKVYAKTWGIRWRVLEEPRYWMDVMRRAYSNWYQSGVEPQDETTSRVLLMVCNGKIYADWPFSNKDGEPEPYREPSEALMPLYHDYVRVGEHFCRFDGPLVPKEPADSSRLDQMEPHDGDVSRLLPTLGEDD